MEPSQAKPSEPPSAQQEQQEEEQPSVGQTSTMDNDLASRRATHERTEDFTPRESTRRTTLDDAHRRGDD